MNADPPPPPRGRRPGPPQGRDADRTRHYGAPGPQSGPPQAWSQDPRQRPQAPQQRPPQPRQPRQNRQQGAHHDGIQYAPTQTPEPFVDDDPRYRRRGSRQQGPPPQGPPPRRPGGPDRYGQPDPRRRPPKPRRKRRFRWGRGILIALLLLILAFGGLVIYLDRSLHRVDALPGYPGRVAQTAGTNWLIAGSDSRYGLTEDQQATLNTGGDVGDGRTDTIVLMHVADSGKPTMVSIPRDSYVPIPGHGRDKINAAFAIGGPQLLVQTVEGATGLRIDHYAEIGFGGFAGVVDAVGGVKLCLDQAVEDPAHNISLPAGCQKYDGAMALDFVRERYALPGSDLDRMANQRQFVDTLASTVAKPTTWLNPVRLWNTVDRGVSSLTVDEGTHIWDLARLAWALKSGPVTTTVPIGGFEDTSSGNALFWDRDRAQRFFQLLAEDKQLPADLVTANGFG
ncbi:LCP family protein [Tomitella gaofuii]|uniref:LCP family protein n=1 Tax=Tomitella gaofuii TaxID=2760083 RepID=UPI0015FC56E6|nr:LCP family protein [Tomitella gaofuii]